MISDMESTLYSVDHVKRLTMSLYQIMQIEVRRPLDVARCLRVVCAGTSLFQKSCSMPDTYYGRPWSTAGALYCLAGQGYLFDPRLALRAIRLLEARHVIDRRRVDDRDASSRTPLAKQAHPKRRVHPLVRFPSVVPRNDLAAKR